MSTEAATETEVTKLCIFNKYRFWYSVNKSKTIATMMNKVVPINRKNREAGND